MTRNEIAETIALFLTLTIVMTLVALPTANAQIVGSSESYAFIGATPNPVGVGQETLLHVGITQQLQITQDGWTGITVTVTRPDGTTETLGPFRTDSTGGTGTIYIPAVAGTYKLQTHFPAQWYNFSAGFPPTLYQINYKADDSIVLDLVVTDEPVKLYPGVPLPNEYWTRPIDAQAREWSVIGGNWLGVGQFGDNLAGIVAYNNEGAPESAHVLWTKPIEYGGLTGGFAERSDFTGQYSIFGGDAYEGKFSGAIIVNGKLFYNKYNTIGGTNVNNTVIAVDLHTGEQLWETPLITPDGFRRTVSFGQVMQFTSYNVQGSFAYLWGTSGTRWDAFDITDGRWLFTMTDVPAASTVIGPNGEFLKYTLNQAAGYMTIWNSSAVIDAYWGTNPNSPSFGSWRPQGKTINATGPTAVTSSTPFGLNGYQKNVSIPLGLPGSPNYFVALDIVIGYFRNTYGFGGEAIDNPPFTIWGIDLRPGKEGQLLYSKTHPAPNGNITLGYARVGVEDRVFVIHVKDDYTNYGYSLDTGDKLWGPTEPEYYLSYLETWSIIYDGKLYTHGTKGIIDCYNVQTGEKLWSYAATDPLYEILWSNDWIARIDFIADGKVYVRHSAHSDNNPLPRGAPYICLDATTGAVIWRANGLVRGTDWGGRGLIGDNIIAKIDTYDLLIFALGKGPSATTVAASPKVTVLGSNVVVEGMVTDISPGTQEYARTARFPHGVPAVSDDSMSDWMLHVYKQFPAPSNATGVEVIVEVFDPNSNYYEVGRTTSDASGFYSFAFAPDVPGKYTVVARFAGSKSYWPSFAKTAINIDEAPEATPEPTQAPASIADQYMLPGIGIMVAAIAVVGALILLMLRKK